MMMQFLRNRAARTLAPNEAAVGDRLPYLGHLDEVTLKTRDGLLMQTIHLRGFPFETSSDDELNYRKAMRETLLRGAVAEELHHHGRYEFMRQNQWFFTRGQWRSLTPQMSKKRGSRRQPR